MVAGLAFVYPINFVNLSDIVELILKPDWGAAQLAWAESHGLVLDHRGGNCDGVGHRVEMAEGAWHIDRA